MTLHERQAICSAKRHGGNSAFGSNALHGALLLYCLLSYRPQAAKDSKDASAAKKKRKRQRDSDDEYADASDSGDEFYDRTVAAGGAARGPKKKAGAAAKAKEKAPQQVESAETLYAKRWGAGNA